jgi:RND family efflux transporter MFP subunit
MKKILFILIILVLGIFALRIVHKIIIKAPLSIAQIQEKEGIPVEVIEIRPDALLKFLNVTGIVGSEEEAYLSSKVGGRILEIYKDAGETVKKGEKIIEVDTQSMEIQGTQAENQIKIAESGLNQVKAQFEDAKRDLERMQNLFKDGVISKKELERFELNFQTAKQQYEASLAQLDIAKDNLRIVDTNIEDHSLFAPFDGVVGIRRADVGEVVAPGQLILSLYNLEKLNAQVQVAENDISDVKIGQSAKITIDALNGEELEGIVVKVSGAPDPNTRLFDVQVSFKTIPDNLKPGLFLRGKISVGSKDNIIVLSTQALLKEGSQYSVFVVENNKAIKKQVKLGDRAENKVEIISGIEVGNKIITFGKGNVKEGSLVKIVNENFTVQSR